MTDAQRDCGAARGTIRSAETNVIADQSTQYTLMAPPRKSGMIKSARGPDPINRERQTRAEAVWNAVLYPTSNRNSRSWRCAFRMKDRTPDRKTRHFFLIPASFITRH